MTQVESGKIQLHFESTSTKDIVRYSVEAVKLQAEQKNVKIETNYPDNISPVNADPDKTAWVITNLLSNAINYSYENSNIQLSVKEISDKIILSVQDFGKGIDAKYLPHLFDRYFQVPGSGKTGTGLGLAIGKVVSVPARPQRNH